MKEKLLLQHRQQQQLEGKAAFTTPTTTTLRSRRMGHSCFCNTDNNNNSKEVFSAWDTAAFTTPTTTTTWTTTTTVEASKFVSPGTDLERHFLSSKQNGKCVLHKEGVDSPKLTNWNSFWLHGIFKQFIIHFVILSFCHYKKAVSLQALLLLPIIDNFSTFWANFGSFWHFLVVFPPLGQLLHLLGNFCKFWDLSQLFIFTFTINITFNFAIIIFLYSVRKRASILLQSWNQLQAVLVKQCISISYWVVSIKSNLPNYIKSNRKVSKIEDSKFTKHYI